MLVSWQIKIIHCRKTGLSIVTAKIAGEVAIEGDENS